jgi:hypothetical protein
VRVRSSDKLAWHKPKIVTVVATGPFLCFRLSIRIDGQIEIAPGIPVVVNSTDEKRKAYKRKQRRFATQACRARKKKRNPVTKRIDPVSIFKAALPYSIFKELDAVVIKRLKENPLDADGRPIPFEEARENMIADFVKGAVKKGGQK